MYNNSSEGIIYNFFYGIPHAHTSYSDGVGLPIDAMEYARSKNLDFLFISDHSNFFDGVKKKNFEYDKQKKQYFEKDGSMWFKTRKDVELINNKYNNFVALRGFEMRWFTGGHISILNSQNYLNGKKQRLDQCNLSNWLLSQNNVIAAINHPGRSFKPPEYNSDMNKILKLIEVGNGSFPRKYIRCESYYYKLLDMGWQLGAINGQDNHFQNWGDGDNLTVIISKTLNADSLLDAMRNMRTYSTESRNLKLIYKINNSWMGSTLNLKVGSLINFEIIAEDNSSKIDKLQIISKGGTIVKEISCGDQNIAVWKPSLLIKEKEIWYIIKVIHSNGKWGISSPIFIKPE